MEVEENSERAVAAPDAEAVKESGAEPCTVGVVTLGADELSCTRCSRSGERR